MSFLARITGKEAAQLNEQLAKLQRTLNEAILERESKDLENQRLWQEVTKNQIQAKEYQQLISGLETDLKVAKTETALAKTIKKTYQNRVEEANTALIAAKDQTTQILKELEQKNEDLNKMIAQISGLENQVKDLQANRNFNKKLSNIKDRLKSK